MASGTRPPSPSGMGLRRVATLALPAYLAAASSSAALQDALLGGLAGSALDPYLGQFLAIWTSAHGPAPLSPLSFKQKNWDAPGVALQKLAVQASLVTARDKACFIASQAPLSGAWLGALPLANCGLRLDGEAVRTGVALRLGLHLCAAHSCRCGSPVDTYGDHAFVCKLAAGRSGRHAAINDIIARSFAAAKIPVSLEPHGLVPGSILRPDGATLLPWQRGSFLT